MASEDVLRHGTSTRMSAIEVFPEDDDVLLGAFWDEPTQLVTASQLAPSVRDYSSDSLETTVAPRSSSNCADCSQSPRRVKREGTRPEDVGLPAPSPRGTRDRSLESHGTQYSGQLDDCEDAMLQYETDEDDPMRTGRTSNKPLDSLKSLLADPPASNGRMSRTPSSSGFVPSPVVIPPPDFTKKRKNDETKPRATSPPSKRIRSQRTDSMNPFTDSITTASAVKDESFHMIADFGGLQFMLEKCPFGVQFEVARLLSKGKIKLEDISLDKITKLKGSNTTCARKTAMLLLRDSLEPKEADLEHPEFERERRVRDPWEELDKEEKYLAEDQFAGLGFHKDEDGRPLNWYGGKVIFRAKVYQKKCGDPIKLTLEHAELGPSSNYSRRFGSKNFIRVKVPETTWRNSSSELHAFFMKPFHIGGFVYRAFRGHERNVFLLRTDEIWGNRSLSTERGIGFLDFVNICNPIDYNSEQTMAKWSSRFALGLSSSVPGAQVALENIEFIPDEISEDTGSDMTDGCGFVTRSAQRRMQKALDWPSFPTAIQCRVMGAKGLIITRDRNEDEEAKLWLRPSQKKIQYPAVPDPSHLVIDILRSSHSKTPARLNYEWIINMSENGVPDSAFRELIRRSTKKRLEALLTWNDKTVDGERNKYPLARLRAAVSKAGSVLSARKKRLEVVEARARGYGDLFDDDDDDEDEEEDDSLQERSTAWWPDPISGCPSTLEETVIYLLDSGFHPATCPVLAHKLKELTRMVIDAGSKRCKVEVEMSATAFIVPDPTGELKEGEVFFRSGEHNLPQPCGVLTDQLLGPVLVSRSPCKLPTDVQKWKAVDCPNLRHLINVVVLPIQGIRRAADLLGGGDYDGDKVFITWEPLLVEPFKNASLEYATEPAVIKDMFEKNIKSVKEFVEETAGLPDQELILRLQHYMLSEIKSSSNIGVYDNLYVNAMYKLGYTHPETIRLAYTFTTGLDGIRSGNFVNRKRAQEDIKKYGGDRPRWKEAMDREKYGTKGNADGKNPPPESKRPSHLGSFIMDRLLDIVQDDKKAQLQAMNDLFDPIKLQSQDTKDPHLEVPWNDAIERAGVLEAQGVDVMRKELSLIERHVESCFRTHQEHKSPSKKKQTFTSLAIETRQDILRRRSQEFAALPDPKLFVVLSQEDVARLKASCAYKVARKKSAFNFFCFDVSMRSLCEIKAKALGTTKTNTNEFYELMDLKVPR